jgi:r-opsin
MNLAIFDLLMATEMPFFIANSFYERLRGHHLACNLYAAAGSLSGIGGAITNAMIAFDRYKCISSPMNRLTKNNVLVLIFVTWLWAVPPTLLPALQIWGRFLPGTILFAFKIGISSDFVFIYFFVFRGFPYHLLI